jgi:hypothetical protein
LLAHFAGLGLGKAGLGVTRIVTIENPTKDLSATEHRSQEDGDLGAFGLTFFGNSGTAERADVATAD